MTGPNKSRRKMREIVFSAIYQFDFTEDAETSSAYLERELSFFAMDMEMKLITRKYFENILRRREEIDGIIRKHLMNWTFDHLTSVMPDSATHERRVTLSTRWNLPLLLWPA